MPKLEIRYLPLEEIIPWEDNTKLHDLGAIVQSFTRYGFRDAVIYDKTLNRLVAGHGRILALQFLHAQGQKPPVGIDVNPEGQWLIPVQFGIDGKTSEEAEAFAIDHNNLVAAGMGFQDMARMYAPDFAGVLKRVTSEIETISINQEQAKELMHYVSPPPVTLAPGEVQPEGRGTMAVTIQVFVKRSEHDKAKAILEKALPKSQARVE